MKKIFLSARTALPALILMATQTGTLNAQVTAIRDWTSLYHGAASTQQNINYTLPEGSNTNRMLVVAIASERTAAGTLTVSLTYGDQPLTFATGDVETTSIQHTALYYLNEAGLDAAGTNSILSVTVSGGTIRNTDVWAAVYDYVDQVTPITDSKNYNSLSTPVSDFSFSPALSINAYDQALEVIATYNSGNNQSRTITYAPEWTMILDQTASYVSGFTAYSMRNSIAGRNFPLTDIIDASPTALNKTALSSLTGLSLKFSPPPPPTIQATDVTFSNITSSSFTVKWTNGDGTNRIVIVKQGSAVDAVPLDGTTYTSNFAWPDGQEIAPGNFVVYNATADSVTVVNLEAATTYHVAVYEFSGPPGIEDYLQTVEPARGNATTLPETAVDGDYRSKVTGNWGSPDSWQVYSNGWIDASVAPSFTDGVITIRSGHIISVAEPVTADQVVIEAGGQVSINSGITLTVNDNTAGDPDPIDFLVNGTLYNAGTLITTGDFEFGNGSLYHHNTNGGSIPLGTWGLTSECRITGITNTAPTGLGQYFGNFTWNCPSQSASLTVSVSSNITILGNFVLSSTGLGKLALTSGTEQVSMNISGNFVQTNGTFVLNNSVRSTTSDNVYLVGDLVFTGGTITETSNTGRGMIVFNGNGGMQTLTSGGTFANTIDFTVESGSWLQMGTSSVPAYITGSNGTFTLSAGATLGITSPYGITLANTANPSGGNIRVSGLRTYDSGANYIYNGNVNQYTGDGLPATVNKLTFDNIGGSIRFQSAHSVTNELIITNGSRTNLGTYIHSTNFLILAGEPQQNGSYGGTTSGADHVIPRFFDTATGIINNNAPVGTWLGITTEWNLASNWIGGIPTASSTARIVSYVPNQPVVSVGTTAVSNNLTINNGATLTVNGTANITSVENNGAVTINPGGRSSVQTFLNTGTLNLESDATGMFSFMPGNFSGTGTINARLFLTGGVAGEGLYRWHYLAVPFQQEKSVLTDINPYDLMWYSEPLAQADMWEGWQWHDGYDGTTILSDLQPTEGYSFYNDEDTYVTFTGSTLLTSLPQKNLSFTTFGWNFIGNSLTCGINWDNVILNGDVDPSVNFLKDYEEYYYIQGGPGVPAGTTGSIPPLQGFFVQANAAGASIDFSAAKEHNSTPYYKGKGSATESKNAFPILRIGLEGANLKDETVIWFNENATLTKDTKYDAEKNFTGDKRPQIYSNIQGKSYAINGIPYPETSIDIPLTVRITKSGKYNIRKIQLMNTDGYAFYLKDLEQNTIINLEDLTVYSFSSNDGTINKRFVLTIENLSARANNESLTTTPFNIYTSSGLLNIKLLDEKWEGRQGAVKIIDLTGRTVDEVRNIEFSRSSPVQIPLSGNKGLFFVDIMSSQLRHTGRVVIK